MMITRASAVLAAITAIGCTALQPDHAAEHTAAHTGQPMGHEPAEMIIDRGVVPITPTSTLVATLIPVGDTDVTGTFRFYHTDHGVRVIGNIAGLSPDTKHGCHIHAFGDATDADKGISAGVHFNPFNHEHALPPASHRHAGAFPNLEADSQGNATLDFVDETITLTEGITAIIGRSVIIHEQEDVGAQPWGGAGGRIAIGVIGLAHPEFTPDPDQR